MTKVTRDSSPRVQPPLSVTALSDVVAHELNNIGASLFGFVELAAECPAGTPIDSNLLGELRIGVSRIAGLASMLELLAERHSARTPVALAACVSLGNPTTDPGEWTVQWDCDPSTSVFVDAEQAHRALQLLKDLTLQPDPEAPRLVVELRSMEAHDRCMSCGAAMAPHTVAISITTSPTAPRKYVGRSRLAETSLRRLSVAACAHLSHLAGGHLLQADAGAPLVLILPLATP